MIRTFYPHDYHDVVFGKAESEIRANIKKNPNYFGFHLPSTRFVFKIVGISVIEAIILVIQNISKWEEI